MSTYTLNTIWKFPIQITDYQEIEAPTAFKPVHVGLDPTGAPCIWALVDSSKNKRRLAIWVIGTGNPIPPEMEPAAHIGSFVDGSFVWHVFIRAILG